MCSGCPCLFTDLQRGVYRASKPSEQRLRPRPREFVSLLRPQARVPRERVQSRLREQRREHKVR